MGRDERPAVSIVTPVYNAENYIAQTVGMVAEQTFPDWEMILINDGSRDASERALREAIAAFPEKTAQKFHIYSLEQNGGAANARNFGVRHARGRYLAFLDADDIWLPEKLEKELEFIRQTKAAFAYHSYEFGDADGKGTGRIVHARPRLDYAGALTRTIIFTSTVMFDREQIPTEELMMPECKSEDTALWWQLLRSGREARGLDRVLAIYRRPPVSLSSDKREAIRRIWFLYRKREGLGILHAVYCTVGWGLRAALRRL